MNPRSYVQLMVIIALFSLHIDHPLNYNCANIISITNSDLITPLSSLSIKNETLLAHNMNLEIHQENIIEVISTFVLANNDTQPLNFFAFTINKTIDSVFCFDLIESLQFIWSVNPKIGNLINITLRNPLLLDEICAFSVSYKIRDKIYPIEGALDYLELNYEVSHPRNSITFNLDLFLPIYAEVLDEDPLKPFFPSPSKISEENDIIKIRWELTNRDINESDLFLIRYVPGSAFISNTNSKILLSLLSLFGGLVLGAVAVVLFYTVRKKPVEKQLVTSLLSKSEQEIIVAINLDGGVSTQRRICDKTSFSKSKVSKILAKLEEKDVLIRNRWGRTNKVTITNQSFRQLGPNNNVDTTSED
ncbi:MAG: helix-turn-helix transcriptional regulator [Candidatus Heimdallarchaeota archaeon]